MLMNVEKENDCLFKFLGKNKCKQLVSINPVHKLKHDSPFISTSPYKHKSSRNSGNFDIIFLCYIITIKENAYVFILDENSNTKQLSL